MQLQLHISFLEQLGAEFCYTFLSGQAILVATCRRNVWQMINSVIALLCWNEMYNLKCVRTFGFVLNIRNQNLKNKCSNILAKSYQDFFVGLSQNCDKYHDCCRHSQFC